MKKKILITGGAGFVGATLAIGLKKKYPDIDVISLDNLKRHGSELNIVRLEAKGVRFVHGDVRNYEDLSSVGGIDIIIECSAEPSVLAGYDEPPEYLINTNLNGAINCLELARKTKADFIFLSTIAYILLMLSMKHLLPKKKPDFIFRAEKILRVST